VLTVAGVELVTGAEVADRWGDVRAARLRAWCLPGPHREPLLAAVTVAQLAALYGRPVPPGADPGAAARIPGRSGPENLYDWAACVRADRLARARTSGPTRRISRAA
jgi:hypothetical protein